MENVNCHDVLDRLLSGAGLRKDKELAELLSVSPQAVSQARRKGRVPDRWILQVASRFHLSPDWVFTGRGEPHGEADSAERNAPAQARSLPGSVVYKNSLSGRAPLPRSSGASSAMPEMVMVPLVEANLAAGTGSLQTGGEVLGLFAFRQDWLLRKGNPERMVLMKVFGDSMEPDIRHGDMVLVDQGHTQIFGHAVYAVGVNEEIYIKQVETLPGGTLVLRSFNKRYEPIEVSLKGDLAESVRIIGRIIWWCREA